MKAPERLATAPYALLLLSPSPTTGHCAVLYANDAAAGALLACSPGSEVVPGATLQLPACLEAQQLHSGTLGSHRVYDQAQWQPRPGSDALSIQQLLLFSLQAPNGRCTQQACWHGAVIQQRTCTRKHACHLLSHTIHVVVPAADLKEVISAANLKEGIQTFQARASSVHILC